MNKSDFRIVGVAATLVVGGYFAEIYLKLPVLWLSTALTIIGVLTIVLRFRREYFEHQRSQFRELLRIIDSYERPLAMIAPRLPLPELRVPGAWVATPDFAGLLATTILERKPRVIVELGSGASTLVMAYALQELGSGEIFSLDHDAAFAAETTSRIEEHGLRQFATVIHAPIKRYPLNGESWPWYDDASFATLPEIDMLVVDGPPEALRPMARYPALPLLKEKLSKRCLIILDDSIRPSERNIVNRWIAEDCSFSSHYLETQKGTFVLTRPEPKDKGFSDDEN